jgi:uncharacterized protein (TIGR02466 family)
MNITRLQKNIIFWNFVWSGFPEVDRDTLTKAVYDLRDTTKGITVSNRGGWHSAVQNPPTCIPEFREIEYTIRAFAEAAIREDGLSVGIKDLYWWVNINGSGAYNRPHNHPKTDLSAVYYLKCSRNAGDLVLARTDCGTYGNLFNNLPDGREFVVTPEEGKLVLFPGHLWHWVEPNPSNEDRISITFNIECG